MPSPRIYGWIQNGHGTDMVSVSSLCEDGRFAGSHFSSSDAFARQDIEHLHADEHRELYPDGFEFVFVVDPLSHRGLMEAYRLNQQLEQESKDV